MFLARPGEYEACGMYTIGHLILLLITISCILIVLKFTKNNNKEQTLKEIRNITILLWILEIIKIVFNLIIGNASNPNTYVPLYFCSMILYAGIFSGFCKGKLKHVGDVFIATGGMIAGIIFLLSPNTSLTMYPILHYISIQSFILHGAMVYLGVLLNITNYIDVKGKDIIYYSGLMLIISGIAYIFNIIFESNLMFISYNFPGTPIEILYNYSGNLFTPIMVILQATGPFYVVYGIKYVVIKLTTNIIKSIDKKLN